MKLAIRPLYALSTLPPCDASERVAAGRCPDDDVLHASRMRRATICGLNSTALGASNSSLSLGPVRRL